MFFISPPERDHRIGLGFSIYWTWLQPTVKWVGFQGFAGGLPGRFLFGSSSTRCFLLAAYLWNHMLRANGRFGSPPTCMDVVNCSQFSANPFLFYRRVLCDPPIRSFIFKQLRRVFPGLFKLIYPGKESFGLSPYPP